MKDQVVYLSENISLHYWVSATTVRVLLHDSFSKVGKIIYSQRNGRSFYCFPTIKDVCYAPLYYYYIANKALVKTSLRNLLVKGML